MKVKKTKSRQCHPLTANAGSRDYGIQALLKMPDNIPAPLIQVINDTIS
ncbi:hypothetical protein ECDEC4C_2984 [Escherichia coli DEC4C]|nr:hypothetical protein ECDEC4C_2984 [Escherichia coli DEC4C]EHW23936.1 hypothetical protein ECDEC8C_0982 [Escherichia coli DEC8C]